MATGLLLAPNTPLSSLWVGSNNYNIHHPLQTKCRILTIKTTTLSTCSTPPLLPHFSPTSPPILPPPPSHAPPTPPPLSPPPRFPHPPVHPESPCCFRLQSGISAGHRFVTIVYLANSIWWSGFYLAFPGSTRGLLQPRAHCRILKWPNTQHSGDMGQVFSNWINCWNMFQESS